MIARCAYAYKIKRAQQYNISELFSIIVALFPIIYRLRVPFVSQAFGTVVIFVMSPFLIMMSCKTLHVHKQCFLMVIWLGFMLISGSEVTVIVFSIIFICAASDNVFDVNLMRRVIENISILSFFLVALQSLAWYILNIELRLYPTAFAIANIEDYYNTFEENLYRPASIFLEPSHYIQYAIIGFISILDKFDSDKKARLKAFLIGSGIILTTSGMGVAFVFIFSLIHFSIKYHSNHKISIFKTIKQSIIVCAVLTALLILFMKIPLFNATILRIIDNNVFDSRWLYAKYYIKQLSGSLLIFGKGTSALPKEYFPDLARIIYCNGYIGAVSLYFFLFVSLLKSKTRFQKYSMLLLMLLISITRTMFSYTSSLLLYVLIFGRSNVSSNNLKK